MRRRGRAARGGNEQRSSSNWAQALFATTATGPRPCSRPLQLGPGPVRDHCNCNWAQALFGSRRPTHTPRARPRCRPLRLLNARQPHPLRPSYEHCLCGRALRVSRKRSQPGPGPVRDHCNWAQALFATTATGPRPCPRPLQLGPGPVRDHCNWAQGPVRDRNWAQALSRHIVFATVSVDSALLPRVDPSPNSRSATYRLCVAQ